MMSDEYRNSSIIRSMPNKKKKGYVEPIHNQLQPMNFNIMDFSKVQNTVPLPAHLSSIVRPSISTKREHLIEPPPAHMGFAAHTCVDVSLHAHTGISLPAHSKISSAHMGISPLAHTGILPPAHTDISLPAHMGISPSAHTGFSPSANRDISLPAHMGISPSAHTGFSPSAYTDISLYTHMGISPSANTNISLPAHMAISPSSNTEILLPAHMGISPSALTGILPLHRDMNDGRAINSSFDGSGLSAYMMSKESASDAVQDINLPDLKNLAEYLCDTGFQQYLMCQYPHLFASSPWAAQPEDNTNVEFGVSRGSDSPYAVSSLMNITSDSQQHFGMNLQSSPILNVPNIQKHPVSCTVPAFESNNQQSTQLKRCSPTVSSSTGLTPKKLKNAQKKTRNTVSSAVKGTVKGTVKTKKPLNSFMLFLKEMRAKVAAATGLTQTTLINRKVALLWKTLPHEEREKYYEKSKEAHEIYNLLPSEAKLSYGRARPVYGSSLQKTHSKCRAFYGLEELQKWCNSCKRKKKCTKFPDGFIRQCMDQSVESVHNSVSDTGSNISQENSVSNSQFSSVEIKDIFCEASSSSANSTTSVSSYIPVVNVTSSSVDSTSPSVNIASSSGSVSSPWVYVTSPSINVVSPSNYIVSPFVNIASPSDNPSSPSSTMISASTVLLTSPSVDTTSVPNNLSVSEVNLTSAKKSVAVPSNIITSPLITTAPFPVMVPPSFNTKLFSVSKSIDLEGSDVKAPVCTLLNADNQISHFVVSPHPAPSSQLLICNNSVHHNSNDNENSLSIIQVIQNNVNIQIKSVKHLPNQSMIAES